MMKNPKLENRMPKEIRNPNADTRLPGARFFFRISGFVPRLRDSDFGFRISNFRIGKQQ